MKIKILKINLILKLKPSFSKLIKFNNFKRKLNFKVSYLFRIQIPMYVNSYLVTVQLPYKV